MQTNISTKEIIPYLLLVLVALASIASIVLLGVPWIQSILDLNQEIQDGWSLVENKLKPKVETLNSQDSTVLDENFKLVITALPDEENPLSLMNTLEKFGKAYSVDLQGVRYAGTQTSSVGTTSETGETSAAKTQSTSMALSTSGNYATLVALIKGFEDLLPLTELTSLKFTKGQEGTGQITLSFESLFFYQTTSKTLSASATIESLTSSEQETLTEIQQMKTYPLVPIYQDTGKDDLFR